VHEAGEVVAVQDAAVAGEQLGAGLFGYRPAARAPRGDDRGGH
jgi:hypothetical protein